MTDQAAQPEHDEVSAERASPPPLAAKLYGGLWDILVEWFRVPREQPASPRGAEADAFKPSRGFLEYLKMWFWIACLAIDLIILFLWIVIAVNAVVIALLLLVPFLAIAIAPDIVAYVAVHLRYDTTWYVLTDRSVRIRRGVWQIHETTITFENVQNVKVTQGPIQRLFDISNLVIETAGGGGGGQSHHGGSGGHRGVIEGVADAARIRDRIMQRVRASTSAGLGDEREDDRSIRKSRAKQAATAWTAEHLALLRDIRNELAAIQ